ncbi:hypothetical protein POPTR_008G017001v4 [Populus trichocarpa]|uniref:Uncharacterized protein n=1 Tax=Populus trichocarpa TaxID=3694 RepID=A0ACC0SJ02_POPTR|nr:hypothetical protein BDE02_08G013200 [Populus trichocarpa]KAI9389220.1 hypothetical protein POPTR_008G017001v4 [Populus trichocarpa]
MILSVLGETPAVRLSSFSLNPCLSSEDLPFHLLHVSLWVLKLGAEPRAFYRATCLPVHEQSRTRRHHHLAR